MFLGHFPMTQNYWWPGISICSKVPGSFSNSLSSLGCGIHFSDPLPGEKQNVQKHFNNMIHISHSSWQAMLVHFYINKTNFEGDASQVWVDSQGVSCADHPSWIRWGQALVLTPTLTCPKIVDKSLTSFMPCFSSQWSIRNNTEDSVTVYHIKSLPTAQTSLLMPVGVLTTLLWIRFLTNAQEKSWGNGPGVGTFTTHVRDPDEFQVSWFLPGLVPVIEVIWEMNQ